MIIKYSRAFGVAFLVLLSGCALNPFGAPKPGYFENVQTGEKASGDSHLAIADLIDHIVCETTKSRLDELADDGYLVQFTLTLKVDDNIGLSPSLGFIKPYAVSGTSLTYGVNGNLNADQQNSYTTTFAINLKALKDDKDKEAKANHGVASIADCDRHGIFSLSGDLGIDSVVDAGLIKPKYHDTFVTPPSPGGGKPSAGFQAQDLIPHFNELLLSEDFTTVAAQASAPPALPSFGSTIQFGILRSLDAGPTWSVKHFKGPSGSKGILNGGETNTDTLIVAFSTGKNGTDEKIQALLESNRLTDQDKKKLDDYKSLLLNEQNAQALLNAQILTNNMILQNLSVTSSGQ